ncbi:hypothetical protein ACFQBZ_20060 [Deinococcus radiophilus]
MRRLLTLPGGDRILLDSGRLEFPDLDEVSSGKATLCPGPSDHLGLEGLGSSPGARVAGAGCTGRGTSVPAHFQTALSFRWSYSAASGCAFLVAVN